MGTVHEFDSAQSIMSFKRIESNQIELTTQIELRAHFYDLDPMGVVWHGNYFRFFEQARVALMESIQYGYQQMRESGFSWPVIDSRTRYIRPIRLGQTFRVEAQLLEWENCLRVGYEIRDIITNERLTRGYTTQVAIDMATSQMCFRSPDALLQRIRSR